VVYRLLNFDNVNPVFIGLDFFFQEIKAIIYTVDHDFAIGSAAGILAELPGEVVSQEISDQGGI
jgi:hypothetical protein